MTLRIAWLATARGTSSRLLFERTQAAIRSGALDAEIVVVFCNRERGQSANSDAFLGTVNATGTPLVSISSRDWRKRVDGEISTPGSPLAAWRHDFDAAVYERITAYRPDIGMLAGYMLISSEELCNRLPLLNLHPAAPGGPVGTWQAVIRELIDHQATTSGLMIQRSTTDLDRGPIMTSASYVIRGGNLDPLWTARSGPATDDEPLFQAIRTLGVRREPVFVIESLRAIADGRMAIPTPDAAGPNLDLSAEVEAAAR